jgi:DNA-nicking Smr family endonuclease
MKEEGPVEIPIEEELDLHSFVPRDIPDVVGSYLDACRERGLFCVRLVHGRGKGVQRAVVQRLLSTRDDVVGFHDAAPEQGGWGATRVWLRPRDQAAPLTSTPDSDTTGNAG